MWAENVVGWWAGALSIGVSLAVREHFALQLVNKQQNDK